MYWKICQRQSLFDFIMVVIAKISISFIEIKTELFWTTFVLHKWHFLSEFLQVTIFATQPAFYYLVEFINAHLYFVFLNISMV